MKLASNNFNRARSNGATEPTQVLFVVIMAVRFLLRLAGMFEGGKKEQGSLFSLPELGESSLASQRQTAPKVLAECLKVAIEGDM